MLEIDKLPERSREIIQMLSERYNMSVEELLREYNEIFNMEIIQNDAHFPTVEDKHNYTRKVLRSRVVGRPHQGHEYGEPPEDIQDLSYQPTYPRINRGSRPPDYICTVNEEDGELYSYCLWVGGEYCTLQISKKEDVRWKRVKRHRLNRFEDRIRRF